MRSLLRPPFYHAFPRFPRPFNLHAARRPSPPGFTLAHAYMGVRLNPLRGGAVGVAVSP
jgi:hypothetical protein